MVGKAPGGISKAGTAGQDGPAIEAPDRVAALRKGAGIAGLDWRRDAPADAVSLHVVADGDVLRPGVERDRVGRGEHVLGGVGVVVPRVVGGLHDEDDAAGSPIGAARVEGRARVVDVVHQHRIHDRPLEVRLGSAGPAAAGVDRRPGDGKAGARDVRQDARQEALKASVVGRRDRCLEGDDQGGSAGGCGSAGGGGVRSRPGRAAGGGARAAGSGGGRRGARRAARGGGGRVGGRGEGGGSRRRAGRAAGGGARRLAATGSSHHDDQSQRALQWVPLASVAASNNDAACGHSGQAGPARRSPREITVDAPRCETVDVLASNPAPPRALT